MTCLVQSFEAKNFISHLSPLELDHFLKLKTITEQYLFLKDLTYIPLKLTSMIKVKTWKDVEEFAYKMKDGILLFWGDTNYTGHALPVTNGKIQWLPFDKNTELSKYLVNLTVSFIKRDN